MNNLLRSIKSRILKRNGCIAFLLRFGAFHLSGIMSHLVKRRKPDYDLVFVHGEASGWILEGISNEIASRFQGKTHFAYSSRNLPSSNAYYFSHYSLVEPALRHNPHVWGRKMAVFYTHPRDIGLRQKEIINALSKATKVFAMCSAYERQLLSSGLSKNKITSLIGGADPDMFKPHERTQDGLVGFCAAFYERKNPEKILEIVKIMPHRRFVLVGRNWRQFKHFDELVSLQNFKYLELEYIEYPSIYAQMSVFVSVSAVEGGPIPLLEAMMCNVVPVISRTGFGPDFIRHGIDGYIFEQDDSIETISHFIEDAFENKYDVYQAVQRFSWENFSKTLLTEAQII
jgi:glycosyltransferase involved in cell wall biosynthesis